MRIIFINFTDHIGHEKDIQSIMFTGKENGELLKYKLNMFADESQLFNKNGISVKR